VLDQIDKKEERTISKDYKVRYIPKTMLFKKGKEVYSRAGDIEKEDLKSLLDEYLLDKKSDSKNLEIISFFLILQSYLSF